MPTSYDKRLFLRHISDLADAADRQYVPKFTAFLDETEQGDAAAYLKSAGYSFAFFGGHADSTRQVLGIFPDGQECGGDEWGIFPLTCTFRQGDGLSHRDFLGSFMSLGIKREMLGDILVCDGYAVIFCTEVAKRLILDEISKIGRAGVRFEEGITRDIPPQQFEELDCVAASLRADCIVGAAAGVSRDKSAALIKSGAFRLCGIECTNVSKNLAEGDVFSVRGYGKFVLSDVGAVTHKGRLHVGIKKYV